MEHTTIILVSVRIQRPKERRFDFYNNHVEAVPVAIPAHLFDRLEDADRLINRSSVPTLYPLKPVLTLTVSDYVYPYCPTLTAAQENEIIVALDTQLNICIIELS